MREVSNYTYILQINIPSSLSPLNIYRLHPFCMGPLYLPYDSSIPSSTPSQWYNNARSPQPLHDTALKPQPALDFRGRRTADT